LILPKLIEQPTWGGDSIAKLKNWNNLTGISDKKIGQSYELFDKSKLLLHISDSAGAVTPDLGNADTDDHTNLSDYKENTDFVIFKKVAENLGEKLLGPAGLRQPTTLLIKINHAYGNSFQLHIKPSEHDSHWQPKAESWYYFEDGLVSCGIKKGINIEEYKKVCHEINNKMIELSEKIKKDEITFEDAKKISQKFIEEKNPKQFVNIHRVPKNALVDLSLGGIHHSWEEDRQQLPGGNFLYEVQQDVMDPVCTIRAFDQGKIKSDGTVRKIHIDDYFKYLDTDPTHNDINFLMKKKNGRSLLKTQYYCMDILEINGTQNEKIGLSYDHLFVREGAVNVQTQAGSVHLTRGHSCLVPFAAGEYKIISERPAVVLKTFIE
jgi:hypothetical protein